MAKAKTVYVCQNCGAQSPKWIGRCYSCNEWNTYTEEVQVKEGTAAARSILPGETLPRLLADVPTIAGQRIKTGFTELDRLLGGGIVAGSVILLGGEPGIGKSTLALQLALNLNTLSVLYISGEESASQVKLRAERMEAANDTFYIHCETRLESILAGLEEINPGLLIVDSIQTIYTDTLESTTGSVAQIRECTNVLLRYAKRSAIPVILIGHINKEGLIAGPKVLEHIVDVVLQFEGDQHHLYRILRASKNRFGSTAELGIFEMNARGLSEISNPSEILLDHHEEDVSGIARAAAVEGIRPLLLETQALVSTAAYGTPQRSTTGFDIRRLHMLLAVLEKRAGFRLAAKDVFLNIAGGIRVTDPAIDLAIVTAVLSSGGDISVPSNYCFTGEVGLSGEIRTVNRIDQRIGEAAKLGFSKIFIPRYNKPGSVPSGKGIEIVPVAKVEQLFKILFG